MHELHAIIDGSGTMLPGLVAVATDRNETIFEAALPPFEVDSVLALYSCTKPIVATAVLQLVETGRLDLDAPAKIYVPELAGAQVLAGFDADGQPQLRSPKRDITTRMLLLHTAGFAYDFCNADYARLAVLAGRSRLTAGRETFLTPLLFDPGDDWHYSTGIDWAGFIVEALTGRRLGDYLREHVLGPLGMHDTAFGVSAAMAARVAPASQRSPDGTLHRAESMVPAEVPEWDRGGGGLYGTAPDYARFIRMWLNNGDSPGGRILSPDTVSMAAANGLGTLKVKMLPGVLPHLANDAEFFPGAPKSWGLSFMLNDEPAPTGRSAGSMAWAGLGNLYFWIDRSAGLGGFWATQLLPFADPAALAAFATFETAVYDAVSIRRGPDIMGEGRLVQLSERASSEATPLNPAR